MKKPFFCVALGAFCVLMLTGCLKNNMDTIALPEIIIVEEVPDDVIPLEIREDFEKHMTIYEGRTPPNIQGQYLLADYLIEYTSDGQFKKGDKFGDRYVAFFSQVSGRCRFEGLQGGTSGKSDQVYVSGIGNDFTAYYVADNLRSDGVTKSTMSTLFSGTVTEAGIRNCKYAFIMLDKYDPKNELMDVNQYRVFYDADGLAVRYNWHDDPFDAPARFPNSADAAESCSLSDLLKSNPEIR